MAFLTSCLVRWPSLWHLSASAPLHSRTRSPQPGSDTHPSHVRARWHPAIGPPACSSPRPIPQPSFLQLAWCQALAYQPRPALWSSPDGFLLARRSPGSSRLVCRQTPDTVQGRQILTSRAACVLPAAASPTLMEQSSQVPAGCPVPGGVPGGSTLRCPCWILHPGAAQLCTKHQAGAGMGSGILPQLPGQAVFSCPMGPSACFALLWHEHQGLVLTRCPFDGEKPPSCYP